MEQKFNVGDRVRCVDGNDTEFDPEETYVVLEADDDYLYFDEPFDGGWLMDRFELVEDVVTAVAIPTEDVPQEDIGSAATSKHYNEQAIQPIELMQLSLSLEEFKGFLKGNIMKYSMRAGSKAGESVFKDTVKAKQYKMWLDLVEQGTKIDPRVHVVIKGQ